MHSNHFEQISQVQNFNALNIKRGTDSEVKMIAIDQSRKRGTSTGWNLVERENEGHSQSQLYHEVSPRLLHFPTNAMIALPFFIPIYIIADSLFAMIFSVRPNVSVFVSVLFRRKS